MEEEKNVKDDGSVWYQSNRKYILCVCSSVKPYIRKRNKIKCTGDMAQITCHETTNANSHTERRS